MQLRLLSLLFCFSLTFSSCAHFTNTDELIGPYPAVGSVEEKKDIDELLYLQKTRTPEQCSQAAIEANTSLKNFFGGTKGPLSDEEVSKIQKHLKWITLKAGVQILINKMAFSRPRPYTNHPEIKPCLELEFSKAYPSGHSTIARMYARILSVIYPERSSQFLKRADEIALNRVLGGVHHPSDVAAGKILGDALAETYLSDKDFRNEMEQLGKMN